MEGMNLLLFPDFLPFTRSAVDPAVPQLLRAGDDIGAERSNPAKKTRDIAQIEEAKVRSNHRLVVHVAVQALVSFD